MNHKKYSTLALTIFKNVIRKIITVARLLASRDLVMLHRRLRINVRSLCLRYAHGRPFVYRLGGIPMVCFPGIADSEESYLAAETDDFEMMLLRCWLQSGDAFIDVGANFGIYSFAACHFLRDQGVFLAIEASPELHKYLGVAAQMLGWNNIIFEKIAVGDALKEITFHIAPVGKSTGEQSLYPDPVRLAHSVPCRVQMTTLAEIVIRHPEVACPSAVKLDIEGAEPLALQAAPQNWFTPAGPLFIVEVNPSALARGGSTCAVLVSRFPSDAFECWLLPHYSFSGIRNLPLRRLSHEERFDDAWFYNLIAVPRGVAFSNRRKSIQPIIMRATWS